MMREAIEQGGDASSVGKYLIPFFERPIRSDNNGTMLVPAVDYLVQKVSGVVVIGKIGEFVYAQQLRAGTCLNPAAPQLWGVALQMIDEVGSGAEHDGISGHDRCIGDVFDNHCFPQTIAPEQD